MSDWVKLTAMTAGAALFAFWAFHAIKTGRLKPSRHDRVYRRCDDPGTFWFHVVVYGVVAIAFLMAATAWA